MNLDRIGVSANPSERKAVIQSRGEQGDRAHSSKAGIWSTTIIGWLEELSPATLNCAEVASLN